MTKSKLALVAIICLAFAPAAMADNVDSTPPNSAAYGYTGGSQTQQLLRANPYQAMAQAPRKGGQAAPNRVRPFTAEEEALFERQNTGGL
jgi:hypothetical protein